MSEQVPRIALVLSGGNALGAYHAGVYEALHEAGEIPSWISATSIGAITAALIAGNPPEMRLDRLEAFWRRAAAPSGPVPALWSRPAQLASALQARLLGRPGLFHTRSPGLSGVKSLGLHDAAPMRRALLELVDFDRLNGGEIRLTVLALDLASGAETWFDTTRERIGPDHLMASAALIPDFPPVPLGDRVLVDGGFAANLPLDPVLDEALEAPFICYAAELFPRAAPAPGGWLELAERQSDLTFTSQTARMLRSAMRIDALRRAGGEPGFAHPRHVFHIALGGAEEGSMKAWDFSDSALTRRWKAGRADAAQALAARRAIALDCSGLVVHNLAPKPS
jgi:NTE family protein